VHAGTLWIAAWDAGGGRDVLEGAVPAIVKEAIVLTRAAVGYVKVRVAVTVVVRGGGGRADRREPGHDVLEARAESAQGVAIQATRGGGALDEVEGGGRLSGRGRADPDVASGECGKHQQESKGKAHVELVMKGVEDPPIASPR